MQTLTTIGLDIASQSFGFTVCIAKATFVTPTSELERGCQVTGCGSSSTCVRSHWPWPHRIVGRSGGGFWCFATPAVDRPQLQVPRVQLSRIFAVLIVK